MSEVHHHSLQKRSKSTRTRKRLQKKIQNQKENGFVLDCLNQSKSKLQNYNSISDKFLNYFVIRVHPNLNKTQKKPHKQHTPISKVSKVEHIEQLNHNRFQQMLLKQKAKITTPTHYHSKHQSMVNVKDDPTNKNRQVENEKMMNEINQSIKYKERQQTIKQQVEQEELQASVA